MLKVSTLCDCIIVRWMVVVHCETLACFMTWIETLLLLVCYFSSVVQLKVVSDFNWHLIGSSAWHDDSMFRFIASTKKVNCGICRSTRRLAFSHLSEQSSRVCSGFRSSLCNGYLDLYFHLLSRIALVLVLLAVVFAAVYGTYRFVYKTYQLCHCYPHGLNCMPLLVPRRIWMTSWCINMVNYIVLFILY